MSKEALSLGLTSTAMLLLGLFAAPLSARLHLVDSGDSGSHTGDTSETGDTSDTADSSDTADTSETADPDTAETQEPRDSGPWLGAAALAGDHGGCGCASSTQGGASLPASMFLLVSVLWVGRRRTHLQ